MRTDSTVSTDIFCKVIDNYGDIGVCWRVCTQLAARGESVRFIVDDASALAWMAGDFAAHQLVEIVDWDDAHQIDQPANTVIESFGCELPERYIEKMALQAKLGKASRWFNLEYLTAERYAEECHLLPSPVMHGAGKGLTKIFFYPGFTHQTGGLMREPDLLERQAKFDKAAWLKTHNIERHSENNERIVSLFCYEPAALSALLTELQNGAQPTLLLATAGRATQAVKAAVSTVPSFVRAELVEARTSNRLRIHYLPHLTQEDYDHLLWVSDFNFVRGEDSLVRAIWAGKPFVWQIYPQEDDAHHAKLEAFLEMYLEHADANVAEHIRAAHHVWNDISKNTPADHILIGLPKWQAASLMRRVLWTGLPDLIGELLAYAYR